MKYAVYYSIDRDGWCVYEAVSRQFDKFVAGPFGFREDAHKERRRLIQMDELDSHQRKLDEYIERERK